MKKTKESILKIAHRLFNKYGVAAVSLRQIASEAGISHSNLIYHYPTKNDLINALHNQLLQTALQLNQNIQGATNPIAALRHSANSGFRTLYEYRFLMLDLNHILRENKALHNLFKDLEHVRAAMYMHEIEKAVEQKLIRPPLYDNEYQEFVERIKIFSDAWICSAEIYDTGPADKIISRYIQLFMGFFYPYLTEKGRREWERH